MRFNKNFAPLRETVARKDAKQEPNRGYYFNNKLQAFN